MRKQISIKKAKRESWVIGRKWIDSLADIEKSLLPSNYVKHVQQLIFDNMRDNNWHKLDTIMFPINGNNTYIK